MTRHEKTGLMYTKYTRSYKTEYLHCCTSYVQSASCIRLCRNDCISGDKFVKIPCLHKKLFDFEIQKCGQILCVHKTHFLMPGHIYTCVAIHIATTVATPIEYSSVLLVGITNINKTMC